MSPLLVLESDHPRLAPAPPASLESAESLESPAQHPTIASPTRTVLWHDAGAWMRSHPLATRRTAAALFAAAMVTTAVAVVLRPASGETAGVTEATPAVAVDPDLARVATATMPLVDVYADPTQAVVTSTLAHPTPTGGALVFLVLAEWESWLKVALPTPPQGTVGWIRSSAVELAEHRVRITIDLEDRVLVAYRDGMSVLRAPIAVGLHDLPAPGETFVTERLTLARGSDYGRFALPLAGYGNGPEMLFRGKGLVALHGTDRPTELGQSVNRGSIALAPADIEALHDLAPVGTPVAIVGSSSS